MADINSQYNRVVWVDIPVVDLTRAAAFYQALLNCEIHIVDLENSAFGVIASAGGNAGCLIPGEPQTKGILIYMNVEGRIRDAVTQVTNHGGQVTQRIHTIAPHGFRAVVIDSEGNRIALHSMTDA